MFGVIKINQLCLTAWVWENALWQSVRESPPLLRAYSYLERLLASVNQLVPLQLGTLHEGFAAFRTHVHTRPVSVQVLPHCRVVPEHLRTSLRGIKGSEWTPRTPQNSRAALGHRDWKHSTQWRETPPFNLHYRAHQSNSTRQYFKDRASQSTTRMKYTTHSTIKELAGTR